MTVDELTRNANRLGYEKGSMQGIQVCMAWLDARGEHALAGGIEAAAANGELQAFLTPAPAITIAPPVVTHHPCMVDKLAPVPVSPTDLGPTAPKLVTRATASFMGFTGNCCSTCGSYQMVRNGTCEKCQDCGSTTGCS